MHCESHRPGSFCTTVLRTRDPQRAAAFYHALGGWTIEPVASTRQHFLMLFDGKIVASVQAVFDERDEWVPHVSVLDSERVTARALELGAVLVETLDVAGFARLATLRDPEGALFGLWQAAPHQGAQLKEDIGSLWWLEVMSRDIETARRFYGRLFDWQSHDTVFQPFHSYTVFKRGEAQEGGLMPLDPEWDLNPTWNSIFAVSDCDAALEKANRLGASTTFVHTVPTAGRIGGLRDPGGASLLLRGPVPQSVPA
jgi:predicted enzyme related to lactoylglutathione lyase